MPGDLPDWNVAPTGQAIAVGGDGVFVIGLVSVPATLTLAATYTVPAGRKFFMAGMTYGLTGGPGIQGVSADIEDNMSITFLVANATGQTFIFDVPLVFSGTHVVVLKMAQTSAPQVNMQAYATFWGWLV